MERQARSTITLEKLGLFDNILKNSFSNWEKKTLFVPVCVMLWSVNNMH